MKRIFCLFLFVVMLMSACISFAEVEEEIKFRGVEWGLSYPDTMQALTSLELKWQSGDLAKGRKIDSQASGEWSNYYDYDCLIYVETSSSSPSIKVAGYDMSGVTLYFACTENNGVITHDDVDTSFYMAKYRIKPKDLQAVYDDFVAKLTSVYGDPDKTYTDSGFITYNYTYWYGKNDTMIILASDDNWGTVDINYVWAGGEELMQKANDIQHQAVLDEEASHFGTDNTDGL